MKVVYPEHVIDEKGHKYLLNDILGAGGQGAVFTTNDQNIVIKCVMEEVTIDDEKISRLNENPDTYKKFKRKMDEVRILYLPPHLPIARPVLLLKPPVHGYVMRLLSDMVPISKLMLHSGIRDNELQKVYNETGGLKRRLEIVSNLAKIFAELQSRRIVYADISGENVFISSDTQENHVWLIDADNMRYIDDINAYTITPGYAAPEVFNRKSKNTPESDTYSFAILAFQILAWNHPFYGNLYRGITKRETAEQIEENAQPLWVSEQAAGKTLDEQVDSGEFPWIFDEDDDLNQSDIGLTREKYLHTVLFDLFNRTFNEEGKNNPNSRPSMMEWYKKLKRLSKQVIDCKQCGCTYFPKICNECPDCKAPNAKYLKVQMYEYLEKSHFDLEKIREVYDENMENANPLLQELHHLYEINGVGRTIDEINETFNRLFEENEEFKHLKEEFDLYLKDLDKPSKRVMTYYLLLQKSFTITLNNTDIQNLPLRYKEEPALIIHRNELGDYRIFNQTKYEMQLYKESGEVRIPSNSFYDTHSLKGVNIVVHATKHKKRILDFKVGE